MNATIQNATELATASSVYGTASLESSTSSVIYSVFPNDGNGTSTNTVLPSSIQATLSSELPIPSITEVSSSSATATGGSPAVVSSSGAHNGSSPSAPTQDDHEIFAHCDEVCRKRWFYSVIDRAARTGVSMTLSNFKSREWCFEKEKDWCTDTTQSTISMITRRLAKDHPHEIKYDSCNERCFLKALSDASQKATYWAAGWASKALVDPNHTPDQKELKFFHELVERSSGLPMTKSVPRTTLWMLRAAPNRQSQGIRVGISDQQRRLIRGTLELAHIEANV